MSLRKKIIISVILNILFFSSFAVGTFFVYTGLAITDFFLAGLIILMAALGAGLILSILINKFLKPLDFIQEVALRISQGDLKTRIDESQLNSEFKKLANAFNVMADGVAKSREEVDRKVETQVAEIKEKSQEIEDQQKATINILEDVNSSQEELKLRYKELDVIKSLNQKLGTTLEEATVMKNIALALQDLFPEVAVSFVITPILTGREVANIIHVNSFGKIGKPYLDEIRRQILMGFEKLPLYLKKQAYWQKWIKKDFSFELDEHVRSETENKKPLSHFNVSIAIPNTIAGLINISSKLPNFFDEQKNTDIVNAIIGNATQTIERLKILITLEHSRLQDLVESMRNGVVMFGPNRRMIVANSSAKKVLNIQGGEYTLESILNFMQKGKREGVKNLSLVNLYNSAVQNSKSQRIESLEIDRHFYEVVITPVNDLQKEVSGGAIILHDITHLKEIDRMKTEFVSVASHQLRTPLTAINWYVEMLQSEDAGALNKNQKTFLGEIYKGSVRMVKLVDELLNVSRLETGRLRVSPKLTYLDDLIEDIIHELEPIADKYGSRLVFKKPAKRLPKISLDETLMRQVIHNFITNAIRYSLGEKSEVSIAVAEEGDDYVVSVEDQGIGIPKEAQAKIFEKFFRADNARKKEGEGSGIGMYISKMVMEASMGRVWFKSPNSKKKNSKGKLEGRGTTFYAAIPKKGMLAHEGERELAA